MKASGTRAQVWHGTAKHTSGGLHKHNLMMNKHGRIVSRRKHAAGKRSIKRLAQLGYKAKKGIFTLFRRGKMNGGMNAVGTSELGSELTGGKRRRRRGSKRRGSRSRSRRRRGSKRRRGSRSRRRHRGGMAALSPSEF